MSRSDYAHWNEERDIVWWQEEGRHYGHEDPPDPDDYDYYDEPDIKCEECGNWHDYEDECDA